MITLQANHADRFRRKTCPEKCAAIEQAEPHFGRLDEDEKLALGKPAEMFADIFKPGTENDNPLDLEGDSLNIYHLFGKGQQPEEIAKSLGLGIKQVNGSFTIIRKRLLGLLPGGTSRDSRETAISLYNRAVALGHINAPPIEPRLYFNRYERYMIALRLAYSGESIANLGRKINLLPATALFHMRKIHDKLHKFGIEPDDLPKALEAAAGLITQTFELPEGGIDPSHMKRQLRQVEKKRLELTFRENTILSNERRGIGIRESASQLGIPVRTATQYRITATDKLLQHFTASGAEVELPVSGRELANLYGKAIDTNIIDDVTLPTIPSLKFTDKQQAILQQILLKPDISRLKLAHVIELNTHATKLALRRIRKVFQKADIQLETFKPISLRCAYFKAIQRGMIDVPGPVLQARWENSLLQLSAQEWQIFEEFRKFGYDKERILDAVAIATPPMPMIDGQFKTVFHRIKEKMRHTLLQSGFPQEHRDELDIIRPEQLYNCCLASGILLGEPLRVFGDAPLFFTDTERDILDIYRQWPGATIEAATARLEAKRQASLNTVERITAPLISTYIKLLKAKFNQFENRGIRVQKPEDLKAAYTKAQALGLLNREELHPTGIANFMPWTPAAVGT